ncbi:Hypothetical predicted protein [Mytilus galloprovincialis]|uniref:CUB domain-containing protein n=1 Tax=Mytilus galloprovincialis TaxID=29158 RepID=A0A8B6BT17_MYTGA|nr:Hypothetical predicted protein [Mytilus galloprovincialis]
MTNRAKKLIQKTRRNLCPSVFQSAFENNYPTGCFLDNFKLQCGGKPIQITNGAITLSYYSTSPIARNTTCTVRVFSPISKYPANVIAYFRTFYTDYSQNCVNSRLDIFDSLETTGRAITGQNGLCGTKTMVALYYNSSQPYMTFRFRDVKRITRFQITLTAAHTGTCENNEFRCTNGFCIDNRLVCNGYNNCGNRDDQVTCDVLVLTAGAIVGIVIGSLVTVIAIPFCFIYLICRPRRKQMVYNQM